MTVTYTDSSEGKYFNGFDGRLALATFGKADIVLVPPASVDPAQTPIPASSYTVTVVGEATPTFTGATENAVRVVYRFVPPGGFWNAPDNGEYTAKYVSDEVSDLVNGVVTNAATDAVTASFTVAVPLVESVVTKLSVDGVTATTSLTAPGQRSMIPNIVITFNELVTGAGSASTYQLYNTTANAPVSLTATSTTVSGHTVVTLTQTTPSVPLANGYYTLTVYGSAITFTGTSQTVGTDYSLNFHRFAGDYTGDTAVDGDDQAFFTSAFNSVAGDANYIISLDLNGDGAIDGDDLAIFAQSYAQGIL